MWFRILFTVTISHTYYSQDCQDFSFIIPRETVKQLKDGKLIAKVREGKLYVLFAADETNAARVSMPRKTLRFGLKLLNPFFSNFTDLNFNASTPIYRNANESDRLDPAEPIALVGQRFSHSLLETTRPAIAILKNDRGQILQQDELALANNRATVSYDLAGLAEGVYRVEESYPGNTETTAYYADAELQQQGIFGVIEIKVDSSFYTEFPEFEISFSAKQETLKYYVVANQYSETEIDRLSVSDSGFAEDNRLPISFSKHPPSDLTDAEILVLEKLLGDRDAMILFKSEQVVARQEKARRKIQLHQNGEVLIPHLPQPGMSRSNADLFITLSKP